MYGAEICLLDSTYKTCKFDLPLFFVCVQTNVGFHIVASFLVENESQNLITQALRKIKEWNDGWVPEYFMVDFCEREIVALENVFPGITSF